MTSSYSRERFSVPSQAVAARCISSTVNDSRWKKRLYICKVNFPCLVTEIWHHTYLGKSFIKAANLTVDISDGHFDNCSTEPVYEILIGVIQTRCKRALTFLISFFLNKITSRFEVRRCRRSKSICFNNQAHNIYSCWSVNYSDCLRQTHFRVSSREPYHRFKCSSSNWECSPTAGVSNLSCIFRQK